MIHFQNSKSRSGKLERLFLAVILCLLMEQDVLVFPLKKENQEYFCEINEITS